MTGTQFPDMAGKVVAITGASRGIGAAAARRFAEAGAYVALIARNRAATEEVANAINAEVGAEQAIACVADVSVQGEVTDVIGEIVERFERLDVLIGNAGIIGPMSGIETADLGGFTETVATNFTGVFEGIQAAARVMIPQGGGTIITVSSGAAHRPLEGWAAYCSSKAGAYMLTRAADLEFRSRGIRVLGLSPGTVATDMQREIKTSGLGEIAQLDWSVHIPPEWPAEALVWMCGREADPWLGDDVSLREEDVRRKVGLIT